METFLLYNAPQSTCSQRVRFALHAKGIPFEEKKLDLFSGDQLKPDYLALNPNAVVPTLIHNDNIITDSAVILEYLDELKPDTCPLVPRNIVARAHLRALMRFIDEVPTPAIRVPSYNLAFLRHYRSMSEDEFVALAESKPLRKEFLLTMGRTGFSDAEMKSSMDRLARGLERMTFQLDKSGGPWLLGTSLTLADIAVMPVIVRMDDINLAGMWANAPAISGWFDAIRAHPAFQPTYYFGSLLTEKYPELRSELQATG